MILYDCIARTNIKIFEGLDQHNGKHLEKLP